MRRWEMSKELALDVRVALLKVGKTQKWLADQLGITSPYLSDILRGKRSGAKAQEHVEMIKKILNIGGD